MKQEVQYNKKRDHAVGQENVAGGNERREAGEECGKNSAR